MSGFGIVQCLAPLDSASCSGPGRARLGRVLDNSAGYVILDAAVVLHLCFALALPPQRVLLVAVIDILAH